MNANVSISTDGIDIEDWQINVEFPKEKKKIPGKLLQQRFNGKVNLSVWDFAGQELYYASHSFFLSERSIYVVVFDMRYDEENSRVEHWLQSINARAPGTPIIVC